MEGSSRTIDPVEPTADFSAGGLTLADVLVRVDTTAAIAPSRRRDLISAVHRVSTLLDRPPAAIPADPARLRPLLEGLCAARAKVSAQTWANLRSCLAAALRLATGQPASIRRIPISPDWSAVLNLLPDRHSRFGLSRLARFCSAAGIAPADVDEPALERLATHLRTETLCKRPNDLIRRTGVLWNRAVQQVPGWPGRKLTVPSFRAPRRSLRLAELLESFRRDAEAYLDWLGGADPLADHVPPHVCKPRTLRLRRKQIELMASTLIERVSSLEDLRTLADLVKVENAKEILRAYIGNRPDQISAFTRGLAKTLLHIAKHWVRVPPEHLEHLRDLIRRLGPERLGLTAKNQRTLRQFEDPQALARLLWLPQSLMVKARRRGAGSRRAAVQAQLAVAVGVLLSNPIRMNNLVGLRIGEHLVRPGGPKAPFHLILPGEETKNGEPLEARLSAECSSLIDTYVRDFRPAVSGPGDRWLFTTGPGKPKNQSTLALQLRTTIWREAGIRMSPHQFRHLAAKLLLAHDPANFETIRQLLLHRNTSTAINFYAGMQAGPCSRPLRQDPAGIPTPSRTSAARAAATPAMSRTLPFASWPEQDRRAWATIFVEGDVFDGRGPGALWSKATRQAAYYDYGRWLAFLADHQPAALGEPLADRVTPARLRGYAQYLGGLSPITAASYIRRLLSVVRAVAPDRNWAWVAEQAQRLGRRGAPRDKRPHLVDANRLLRLGIDLMARAEATSELTPANRARLYRDGLLIALLICLPVRRRSLAAIRIGRQLERRGEHFLLVFGPEDTKSREPLTFPVAKLLTPHLERYLGEFRPMIPGAAGHDALWASAKGGALTGEGLYERICIHTRAAFGHAINPHLFRSIAATRIAIEDPARIGMARALLGHARLQTTQRHYNQARAVEAARSYQATLRQLRRELRRSTGRHRHPRIEP